MYDRVEQYMLDQYRALRTNGDTQIKLLNDPAEQAVQAVEPAARKWCHCPHSLLFREAQEMTKCFFSSVLLLTNAH
jgi:hypothetical protein